MKYFNRATVSICIGLFVIVGCDEPQITVDNLGIEKNQYEVQDQESKNIQEEDAEQNNIEQTDENNAETASGISMQLFQKALHSVRSIYVEDVTEEELLEYALRGMLNGLDPHSDYLDMSESEELNIRTSGQFGGLGIQVTMEDGLVKVISPIDDTPAHKAGVKAQDLIVKLDNTPVKGLSLSEAIDIMRGKPGTSIKLTIIRDAKPLVVEIVRDIIKVDSAKSFNLAPGYLYLRISTFAQDTAKQIENLIAQAVDDNNGKLDGIVIDLRNNPGGLLNAAVDISDLFLQSGTIVYTKGRIASSHNKFTAKSGGIVDDAAIVVLINEGSASASEIVAGALQDHRRAVVVGTTSFGKGTVQRVLPLSNRGKTMIKLTTSLYYTPSGRSIQAAGIEPDIIVEYREISDAQENIFTPVKEEDLKNHIDNQTQKKTVIEVDSKEDKWANAIKNDYQIMQALNILKAAVISKKIP